MIKYILSIYLFVSQVIIVQAQDTLFLANDSILATPGKMLAFQGDTTIILNSAKKVIEGVLLKNTYLWSGRRLVFCKGGCSVRFNNYGNLISATLASRTTLWTGLQSLPFLNDTEVEFSDDGSVIKGQLSRDIEFNIQDKYIVFLRAEPIIFNGSGIILKGKIEKKEQLQNYQGQTKTYKGGSILFFNDKSEVVESDDGRDKED